MNGHPYPFDVLPLPPSELFADRGYAVIQGIGTRQLQRLPSNELCESYRSGIVDLYDLGHVINFSGWGYYGSDEELEEDQRLSRARERLTGSTTSFVSAAFLLSSSYDDISLQEELESRSWPLMSQLPGDTEELTHLNTGLKELTCILWDEHLVWEKHCATERMRVIAGELIAKAWHPRRIMSCLDTDELVELRRDGLIG